MFYNNPTIGPLKKKWEGLLNNHSGLAGARKAFKLGQICRRDGGC